MWKWPSARNEDKKPKYDEWMATGGLTYAQFLQVFREAHRLNHTPGAREVCVLCGGPLGQTPEVDHWISKSTVPVLSVCADNLLPACGDCNSPTNKANKPVHASGVFSIWETPPRAKSVISFTGRPFDEATNEWASS